MTCDDDAFSPYQVCLRKQIEFFEETMSSMPSEGGGGGGGGGSGAAVGKATTAMLKKKKGRNRPVKAGQVGIRCVHCKWLQPEELRGKGSQYFPASLSTVYQAAQNLSKHHYLLGSCPKIPEEIRDELRRLRNDAGGANVGRGGGKGAWASRARALGVYESVEEDSDSDHEDDDEDDDDDEDEEEGGNGVSDGEGREGGEAGGWQQQQRKRSNVILRFDRDWATKVLNSSSSMSSSSAAATGR